MVIRKMRYIAVLFAVLIAVPGCKNASPKTGASDLVVGDSVAFASYDPY